MSHEDRADRATGYGRHSVELALFERELEDVAPQRHGRDPIALRHDVAEPVEHRLVSVRDRPLRRLAGERGGERDWDREDHQRRDRKGGDPGHRALTDEDPGIMPCGRRGGEWASRAKRAGSVTRGAGSPFWGRRNHTARG